MSETEVREARVNAGAIDTDFMLAVLRLMPLGLPGKVLLDILESQGLDRTKATSLILIALDDGRIKLGQELHLEAADG